MEITSAELLPFIILILTGTTLYYYSELRVFRALLWKEYDKTRYLEQRILELRSKVSPEDLSEAEKFEMECEAEAQGLMAKYSKRDGAFS